MDPKNNPLSAEHFVAHQWRARLKKRRGKAFKSVQVREINLVAMMDMMTIILVFLLKSYSGSALSLDAANLDYTESTNSAAPEDAIKLSVTKLSGNKKTPEIVIGDNETVIKLDPPFLKKMETAASQRQFLIKELYEPLKAKADQAKHEATRIKDKKFEGNILIVADKETPYWFVTQILYSAAEAGYDKYNLVSIKKNE